MPKKPTENISVKSILPTGYYPKDEAPELERHTLMKVTERLHQARGNCLHAAHEIEVMINWLDKQKPNKV